MNNIGDAMHNIDDIDNNSFNIRSNNSRQKFSQNSNDNESFMATLDDNINDNHDHNDGHNHHNKDNNNFDDNDNNYNNYNNTNNNYNNNNYNNNNYNNYNNNNSNYQYHRKRRDFEAGLSKRANEMMIQLKKGKYDCMICQSFIGKRGRIWNCSNCHTIFHLTCVDHWAKARESKQAEIDKREVKRDSDIHDLRCPACSFEHNNYNVSQYFCFCGKINFDHILNYNNNDNITPHSCGDICSKKRAPNCPHLCNALCHPGPCKPCPLPSNKTLYCPCGKLSYTLRCGEIESKPKLCPSICGKLLKCGKHYCKEKCHHDECPPCQERNELECFCGKNKEYRPCGSGIELKTNDGIITKFKCEQICNKLLECGNHRCTFKCHSGSCSGCPRKITSPQMCACGKQKFDNYKRSSCLDKLPTCHYKCDRMLKCGIHFCKQKCHDSECKKCDIPVKKQCRCKAETKVLKCHEYELKKTEAILSGNIEYITNPDGWIQCRKKCKRIMSCGIHKCGKQCCEGRTKSGYQGHRCQRICDKLLNCGKHHCVSYCHTGKCGVCMVTYRNGYQCECGNINIPGPLQCGTQRIPVCHRTCNKLLPCGHECLAKCHSGPCPKCLVICSKACKTHNIKVHNIKCHIKNISCGNRCNKILNCGIHKCIRKCHNNRCQPSNSNKDVGCGQKCDFRMKCGHRCNQKCHPNKDCDNTLCKQQIQVRCQCGNRFDYQICRGRTRMNIKAIPCNEQCTIEERNKRFRSAFGIDIKVESNDNNNNNNNGSKKDIHKIPYSAMELKMIIDYMKKKEKIVNNNVIEPIFVYEMEELFKVYIQDRTKNISKFRKRYPKISVNDLNSDFIAIDLYPMNKHERQIVYIMSTHYYIITERVELKRKVYIQLRKTTKTIVPQYLLSKALIQYQKYPNEIETLESMPPSNMIIIDNIDGIIKSKDVMNMLQPWTGMYRIWRSTDNHTIYLCFIDNKERNSAFTELKKFKPRKATQNDSLIANDLNKKMYQKPKKKKSKKRR